MKLYQKYTLIIAFALSLFSLAIASTRPSDQAPKTKSLPIVFYNVENLFDTINDPLTSDDEFTPNGKKQWNSKRYNVKIDRIAEAILLSDEELPQVVGFAEVENLDVLNDIAKHKSLKKAKYAIVHFDSPDLRGIDLGFLYSAKNMDIVNTQKIPVRLPEEERPTRDIILVQTKLKKGPTLFFYLNHWPSRYGGQEASEYKRLAASKTLSLSIDSLRNTHDSPYIICMGDFNDYPDNTSLLNLSNHSIENMMGYAHSEFNGSYSYKNNWGYLDQFLVSDNLLSSDLPVVDTASIRTLQTDSMIYISKKGNSMPNRTYGGKNYYGGYSDHLPIRMEILY